MKTSQFFITLLEHLCVCLVIFLTAGLFAKPVLATCPGVAADIATIKGVCTVDANTLQGVYGGTGTTNTATLTLASFPAASVTINAGDSTRTAGYLVAGTIIVAANATISLLQNPSYESGTLSTKQICGPDADGDHYAANLTWTAGCATNYVPLATLADLVSTDCNDNNAGVHASSYCYTDADSDTYTVGNGQSYCGGCPGGTTGTKKQYGGQDDCNDGNAGVYAWKTCYQDDDLDTYTVGNGAPYCATSCPTGRGTEPINTTATQQQWFGADDCNDADAAHYYVDIYSQCTLP